MEIHLGKYPWGASHWFLGILISNAKVKREIAIPHAQNTKTRATFSIVNGVSFGGRLALPKTKLFDVYIW